MTSLNHLKENYRARYCYAKGQRQDIDIQEGGNVLKYIQDGFKTCAKEFPMHSPNASHSSSPHSVHTQISVDSKEKKKPRPDKSNCVKTAFNTLATTSYKKNRSSDEDVGVFLESPALLLEEERHTQVTPDQNKIIGKKISKALESLNTTTRSSAKGCAGKRNTINFELENECEFLIEESFGAPSTSWISLSQNRRAKKKSLTVSSETKTVTKLQSIKRVNKRASKKPVAPQAIMKLDVAERTFDTSWNSGRSAVVNDQSQLVVSSIQQARKFACSEHKQSVDQDNEDDQEAAWENMHSEAALLEQDHRFSSESRFIIHTTQQSSFGKPVEKQRSPRIPQSKKQSEVERSKVRTRRRKNRVLVSEGSSEYGEQQCDKKTKNPREQRTDLRKMPPLRGQSVSQTLESCEDCGGNISHREDSCEQYVAEKTLIVSTEQQNSATVSQSSCATDVSRNSGSGPVWYHKYKKTSTRENSSNIEDSVSDESVDLEENSEVFFTNSLKHKMTMPTNTPNVRRTKRIRLKPLEYWRGERVNYNARPSGGFVIGGIISPEQNQPRKQKKKIKAVMESENILDDEMVSIKDPSQPAAVFDPVSHQEILLQCVSSGSSHFLLVTNEALSVYKYLTTPAFSVGKIILKPLKEKGYQYSNADTLIFHIIHGKLLLILYDQHYALATGDYFYIPSGNIYNIRNLLNTECVIVFTQLKGNRLEEK